MTGAGPGVLIGDDELGLALGGARVALATNRSAVDATGRTALERVVRADPESLCLLVPEHGFSGALPPGETDDGADERVPFYFTDWRQPDPELHGFDVMVFGLPLVGTRYYTYLDVLRRVARVAAARGKPLVCFDGPDPQGGELVEGPGVVPGEESEVASLDVAIRYGLSTGELARRVALATGTPAPRVVDSGWGLVGEDRDPSPPPSPNLRTRGAIRLYPALCLVEGTSLSEGRGTPWPFEWVGAPGLAAERVAARLAGFPGFELEIANLVPEGSKHSGVECRGLRVRACGDGPVLGFGVALMAALVAECGEGILTRSPTTGRFFVDKLWGGPGLRQAIMAGRDPGPLAVAGPDPYREAALIHPRGPERARGEAGGVAS